MSKLITGILSVFIVAGFIGVYIPNAMATVMESPFESCGNEAAGQAGNSDAEQGADQGQAGDTDAQSVSPEFNALNGNNLGFQDQQNGNCFPFMDRPPVGDSTAPLLRDQ